MAMFDPGGSGREDNFSTSDPRWRGNRSDNRRDPGYRWARLEGYLVAPLTDRISAV